MRPHFDPDPTASPLHTFGLLIARTADDLASLSFVAEWVGPGERVPVFDAASLRGLADDTDRRMFLAELLASYTHVVSGRVWSRTARGWRKRRYSELDPLWLGELIEALPEARRGAALRRLRPLPLLLPGLFPGHVRGHPIPPPDLSQVTP